MTLSTRQATRRDVLIAQADYTAQWRGHTLVWDRYNIGQANGECSCGMSASVNIAPPPNGIDIGGSAVAVNHPAADDDPIVHPAAWYGRGSDADGDLTR